MDLRKCMTDCTDYLYSTGRIGHEEWLELRDKAQRQDRGGMKRITELLLKNWNEATK